MNLSKKKSKSAGTAYSGKTRTLALIFYAILLSLGEHILANTAKRALEIVGKVLKLGAGSDTVVGIAESLVVLPAASITYVFFHKFKFLS